MSDLMQTGAESAGATPAAGGGGGSAGATPAAGGGGGSAGATPAAGGDILQKIVAARREMLAQQGPEQGESVPAEREVPLVEFGREPFVICEIKRRSPSRGQIAAGADPVMQAAKYVSRNVQSISVLTEPNFFGGSLKDLMRVKRQYPGISVLRKDFLLNIEDIDVSWRAGADAVLLIASVLTPENLAAMHARAYELGMQALVELHSLEELEQMRSLAPPLVGVNSRDLRTFTIDPLIPLSLRRHADWPSRWVFESGIFAREHAALAAASGFAGVLVGEAVMQRPERIAGIQAGLADGAGGAGVADGEVGAAQPNAVPAAGFWQRIAAARGPRPLVKICGLTWPEDVRLADEAGADILGFVFAESPRRADPRMVAALAPTRALKVAVVVNTLPEDVARLLADGHIDAVQFSGDEDPESCYAMAFPYYKAVRLATKGDIGQMSRFFSPRVLVDARSETAEYGGSGQQISPEVLAEIKGPLWLAGGLNPGNVGELVRRFKPELVDVSSGLEAHAGKKDPRKIYAFIQEVRNAVV
jgi:indole-3-glycerol phosphate synthase/phosphoribosylanthranilate isomerase